MTNHELLQRVIESCQVEDVLEILEIGHNIEVEELLDMSIEDVVRLYRRKILNNIEKFDVQ